MQAEFLRNADEMIKANGAAEAARSQALMEIIEDREDRLDKAMEEGRERSDALEKNLSAVVEKSAESTGEAISTKLSDVQQKLIRQMNESDSSRHTDAVRIYKNVQASVVEELQKQTEDLRKELDSTREELEHSLTRIARLQEENLHEKAMGPVKAILIMGGIIILLELLNLSQIPDVLREFMRMMIIGS